MWDEDELRAKKAFYDDLYALDESDGEARDEALVESMNIIKKSQSSSVRIHNSHAREEHDLAASTSSSPSGNSVIQTSALRIFQKRHTTNGLPAAATSSQVPVVVPSTAPPSLTDNVIKDSAKQPAKQPAKLFDGLVFYFFPNNDINPARRIRIKKAIEHGAIWTKDWNASVTHVVVDRSMNYGQVMACLQMDHLPASVSIVDEIFPADCISYRIVLDPSQRRYHIKGYVSRQGNQTLSQVLDPSSAQSDISLQLKPAGKAVTVRQPQTPSAAESSSVEHITASPNRPTIPNSCPPDVAQDEAIEVLQTSELDDAIREAKLLQHMPLDSDDEDIASVADNESDTEASDAQDVHEVPPPKKVKRGSAEWQDGFLCMHKQTGNNEDSPNAQTIAILQKMADYYAQIQDQWRPIAYRKAIAQLRNHPTKIATKEQAIKLPFVGKRLAEKIGEIVLTNSLRRLEIAEQEPTLEYLRAFRKIYGVGDMQASRWVQQGYRSLEDISTKATLNEGQRIGLAHYEDFDTRIPRAEVEQHASIVKRLALSLDKDIVIYTMGSYRRGSSTSGDIDLIFTHPTHSLSKIRDLVFRLITKLFAQGFLKATLAAISPTDGSKWHGASCLPDSTIWRRIDFLLVPREELGAALIYFTGNEIFNRSMRLLAGRKGMRLNQRGLYKGVMRGPSRSKVNDGILVEGADEKKIFAALGVPWRPPKHRIC